jgi:hypothetical protein
LPISKRSILRSFIVAKLIEQMWHDLEFPKAPLTELPGGFPAAADRHPVISRNWI